MSVREAEDIDGTRDHLVVRPTLRTREIGGIVMQNIQASRFDAPVCARHPAAWETKQYEPSVAVTTERGARRRHGCRTYGLDEGRRGNQSDDRENSDKLLHDVLRGGVRATTLVCNNTL